MYLLLTFSLFIFSYTIIFSLVLLYQFGVRLIFPCPAEFILVPSVTVCRATVSVVSCASTENQGGTSWAFSSKTPNFIFVYEKWSEIISLLRCDLCVCAETRLPSGVFSGKTVKRTDLHKPFGDLLPNTEYFSNDRKWWPSINIKEFAPLCLPRNLCLHLLFGFLKHYISLKLRTLSSLSETVGLV